MTRHRIVSTILLTALMAVPCFAGEHATARMRSTLERIEFVRATYAKLARFNHAERVRETGDLTQFDNPLALRFELSDFHAGNISAILNVPWTRLTPMAGEVLTITANGIFEDDREMVAYAARWEPGLYSSSILPSETLGDVLSRYASDYYDVGSYLAYTVTVTFEGRSRTYPALALFHDLYESAEHARPEYWDSVAGVAGILNQVADERRPAFGLSTPSVDGVPALSALTPTASFETPEGCYAYPGSRPRYTNDHPKGGYHEAEMHFTNCCSRPTIGRVRCALYPMVITREDPGSPTNLTTPYCWTDGAYGDPACYFTFHVKSVDLAISPTVGPEGTNVQCQAAVAVGWKRCTDPSCFLTGKLNVGVERKGANLGFEFSVPETGLGSVTWTETNFCNLPVQTASNPCPGTGVTDSADYSGIGDGTTSPP